MTPITVKLRKPIELGSQRIEELTFRPPTGKDFRKLPQGEDIGSMDVTLTLAARLSGQTDVVIDKLEGDDLWEVLQAVQDFTPGGQVTGAAR